MDKLGCYRGRHYTTYVIEVIALINAGHTKEAEQLLLHLIEAVEAENTVEQSGVAPWYYKTLSRIYHAQHNTAAEDAVIARFNRQPYGDSRLSRPARIQPVHELIPA